MAMRPRKTGASSGRPSREDKSGSDSRSSGTGRGKTGGRPASKGGARPRKTDDSRPPRRDQDRPAARPYGTREERPGRSERPSREGGPTRGRSEGPRPARGGARRDDDRPYARKSAAPGGDREKRPYSPRGERSDDREKRPYTPRGEKSGDREKRPYSPRGERSDDREKRPYTPRGEKRDDREKGAGDRPFKKKEFGTGTRKPYGERRDDDRRGAGRPYDPDRKARGPYRKKKEEEELPKLSDGTERLNKFLSNAGIASRREADELIKLGLVKVNGEVVYEMGMKINFRKDKIQYDDKVINKEKLRYIMLNKPKDYITTTDDPRNRKTVMALVEGLCKERIYPVGRLDRQTTGLLLFTNDGDLAKRLLHPKHGYAKIYQIELVEKVKAEHLRIIRDGFDLEDGFIKADEIAYVGEGNDQHVVGIRVHSGRNRIVRRIFEHFGYTVKKLDRVSFAGLTKKDLPRGRARHLTEKEVQFLMMIR
jgi:23S rRNA pseudouridine2605 synthase